MQTRKVLDNLEAALRAARFENADFGAYGSTVTRTTKEGKVMTGPVEENSYIRNRTAVYRGSWIIPQLEFAIAELRSELDKRK